MVKNKTFFKREENWKKEGKFAFCSFAFSFLFSSPVDSNRYVTPPPTFSLYVFCLYRIMVFIFTGREREGLGSESEWLNILSYIPAHVSYATTGPWPNETLLPFCLPFLKTSYKSDKVSVRFQFPCAAEHVAPASLFSAAPSPTPYPLRFFNLPVKLGNFFFFLVVAVVVVRRRIKVRSASKFYEF